MPNSKDDESKLVPGLSNPKVRVSYDENGRSLTEIIESLILNDLRGNNDEDFCNPKPIERK